MCGAVACAPVTGEATATPVGRSTRQPAAYSAHIRQYLFTLARLVGQDAADTGPIALCGRVELIDACARLLLGSGDRRALAPLTRPLMRELRRCSVIVACALSPEEARRAAAAHRPWVALVERDVDRYAYGCLPRLGAGNVLYVSEDGSVPGSLRDRLVAVLDPASASALARRLPPLRASLDARLKQGAMRDAALAGLARADTETLLAAIAGPILWQARARGARRTQLYAPAVAAAAATASAERLLASSPRMARAAGAAACAWAGGRVASLMQGTR